MYQKTKDRLFMWHAMRVARRRGVTMIEYILIAALIAVVAIATMTSVGTKVGAVWTKILDELKKVVPD